MALIPRTSIFSPLNLYMGQYNIPLGESTVRGQPTTAIGTRSGRNVLSSIDVGNIIRGTRAANISTAAGAAEAGTQQALAMASRLDPAVAERFYANLERAFPDFQETFGQMSANTMAMLRGELPPDVEALVRQYAAEAGFQGTMRRTARDLGRTSLDIATQGFTQGATLFEIADRYLTPPTFDVFAGAESIRGQLTAAGAISPAQVMGAQLTARGQDLEYSIASQRLQASIEQFQANLDWQRQLSAMELDYERQRDATLQRMQRQAMAARREESQAFAAGMQAGQLSMVQAHGATGAGTTTTPVPSLSIDEDIGLGFGIGPGAL